jgi:hypothetical protein
MNRRTFIAGLGSAAACPVAGRAQQLPVIAYLSSTEDPPSLIAAFHQGLSELGFVVNRNVLVEHRWVRGWQQTRCSRG